MTFNKKHMNKMDLIGWLHMVTFAESTFFCFFRRMKSVYKSSFLQTAPFDCAEVQTETDVRTVTSEEPPSSRGMCREREEEEKRRGGRGGE